MTEDQMVLLALGLILFALIGGRIRLGTKKK